MSRAPKILPLAILVTELLCRSTFGEVPKEQKFGIAALLGSSSQSAINKVRSGSEVAPIPIPPRDPDPIPARAIQMFGAAPLAASSAQPVIRPAIPAPENSLEARKREIQMLEFRLNQQQALAALDRPAVGYVAVANTPSSAASRLLLSVHGTTPAPQVVAMATPKVVAPVQEELAAPNGGRDLQVVLAYHLGPRGSSKELPQKTPSLSELRQPMPGQGASAGAGRPDDSPRGRLLASAGGANPVASGSERQLSSFRTFNYEGGSEAKTDIRVFNDTQDGAVAGNTGSTIRVFGQKAAGGGGSSEE